MMSEAIDKLRMWSRRMNVWKSKIDGTRFPADIEQLRDCLLATVDATLECWRRLGDQKQTSLDVEAVPKTSHEDSDRFPKPWKASEIHAAFNATVLFNQITDSNGVFVAEIFCNASTLAWIIDCVNGELPGELPPDMDKSLDDIVDSIKREGTP